MGIGIILYIYYNYYFIYWFLGIIMCDFEFENLFIELKIYVLLLERKILWNLFCYGIERILERKN